MTEAEQFKEDDEKAKEIIDARNNFESLVYQFKSTLNDEKLSSVIDENLKTELTEIITENTKWLDNNQMASKEEYETRSKELQNKMKILQEKMMPNMPNMPTDLPNTYSSDETTQGSPKVVDIDDVD